MKEKKMKVLNKRLEAEKKVETMINVIREGISRGKKYISFDLIDGEITTVFIKMDVKRDEMDAGNENEGNLNYIG